MQQTFDSLDAGDRIAWDGNEYRVDGRGSGVLPDSDDQHIKLTLLSGSDRGMNTVRLHENLVDRWLRDDTLDFDVIEA